MAIYYVVVVEKPINNGEIAFANKEEYGNKTLYFFRKIFHSNDMIQAKIKF